MPSREFPWALVVVGCARIAATMTAADIANAFVFILYTPMLVSRFNGLILREVPIDSSRDLLLVPGLAQKPTCFDYVFVAAPREVHND